MSSLATQPRIRIERLLDESDRRSALFDATFWSLRDQPKQLPPIWLYDDLGSRLFEKITRLPEYYPTRTEREILETRCGEIAAVTEARTLVELGSGTSEKTQLLLDALDAAGTLERFVPLDVSEEVLCESVQCIADRYETIAVHAIVADFERHLPALPEGEGRLIAFLGSTIGNLYPERRAGLLAAVVDHMGLSDTFLLGVDLVKNTERIRAAYNDAQGVTETFIRNALTAINRELGADFEQTLFAYEARWDSGNEWVDIGLRALDTNVVTINELDSRVAFQKGELLRVEVSSKFRRQRVERELDAAGLNLDEWWTDADGGFALVLASRRQPAIPQ